MRDYPETFSEPPGNVSELPHDNQYHQQPPPSPSRAGVENSLCQVTGGEHADDNVGHEGVGETFSDGLENVFG